MPNDTLLVNWVITKAWFSDRTEWTLTMVVNGTQHALATVATTNSRSGDEEAAELLAAKLRRLLK